jgi:hypothetical protein
VQLAESRVVVAARRKNNTAISHVRSSLCFLQIGRCMHAAAAGARERESVKIPERDLRGEAALDKSSLFLAKRADKK